MPYNENFVLKLTSDAKIQPAITGREDNCFWLCSPWSRVVHALRPIFMLWLLKIWQVSSWGKLMQHLESCLLWQLKLTEFCFNLRCFSLSFSTGCTKWNSAAIRSLLLFMASLFIGFLVEKFVTCQSRKSDFGWHRFRFAPCLMRKRFAKSELILALLDNFQGCEWKAWVIILFDVCFLYLI